MSFPVFCRFAVGWSPKRRRYTRDAYFDVLPRVGDKVEVFAPQDSEDVGFSVDVQKVGFTRHGKAWVDLAPLPVSFTRDLVGDLNRGGWRLAWGQPELPDYDDD